MPDKQGAKAAATLKKLNANFPESEEAGKARPA
jgi:hypothetical protein